VGYISIPQILVFILSGYGGFVLKLVMRAENDRKETILNPTTRTGCKPM
jgi:hypothetical protein